MNQKFAQGFVNRFAGQIPYNINIMGEDGIILASSTVNRVGMYHESAYKLLNGWEEESVIRSGDRYLGVQEGVNQVIRLQGVKQGVIGITGDPDEVRMVCTLLHQMFEMLLEQYYTEIQKSRFGLGNGWKERFLKGILYYGSVPEDDLIAAAEHLGLDLSLVRIPIVLVFRDLAQKTEEICGSVRALLPADRQDIITMIQDDEILLFLHMDKPLEELIPAYKYRIAERISPALRYLKEQNYQYQVYVGSFQNHISAYHAALEHCRWMISHNAARQHSCYFYDCLADYYRTCVPFTKYQEVFAAFSAVLDNKFLDNFMQVLEVLSGNCFNLKEGSAALHIHKNTLMYRLGKIRDGLGMNPLTNMEEREFLVDFYYYLKRTRVRGN